MPVRAVRSEEDLQCLPRLGEAWQSLQPGQGWAPGCSLAQPDAGFRTVQDFLGAIEQAISEALLPCVCRGHNSADPCQQPLSQGLVDGTCGEYPSVRQSCMPLRRTLGPGWHESKYPKLVLAVGGGGVQIVESAHRLVAFMMGTSNPHQHRAPYALHKPCCPARCVNPLHLRWGSAYDRSCDWVKKVEWVKSCHGAGLWQDASVPTVLKKMQKRARERKHLRCSGPGRRRRNATTLLLLDAKPVLEGKRQPKPSLKTCTNDATM